MDILRITTSGSVDDGKSTLIGRLLYDTRSIPEDKMQAIEVTSKRKGLGFVDLSLLTDGLIAEREQGITIDVAHIYFTTPNRKYIIADTPGHVEYTRNMVTGASNASVSMILIDARRGVMEQTRRHFYIASLLRIRHVVVCINKMDLVKFDKNVFESIRKDFNGLIGKAGFSGQHIDFIPVAAKEGDNIVFPSLRMPWYKGETLLEYLENTTLNTDTENLPGRFPVQHVIRPHEDSYRDFRGYAGKVTSGNFKKGDTVVILPTLKRSVIKSIRVFDIEKTEAQTRESVIIELEDDIDISRGTMLVKEDRQLLLRDLFKADLCWLEDSKLTEGRMYILQHGYNCVKAKITAIDTVLDIHTLDPLDGRKYFQLNDIGEVQLRLAKPVFADAYEENPANGSFILIDEFTNNTVAVGFIKK